MKQTKKPIQKSEVGQVYLVPYAWTRIVAGFGKQPEYDPENTRCAWCNKNQDEISTEHIEAHNEPNEVSDMCSKCEGAMHTAQCLYRKRDREEVSDTGCQCSEYWSAFNGIKHYNPHCPLAEKPQSECTCGVGNPDLDCKVHTKDWYIIQQMSSYNGVSTSEQDKAPKHDTMSEPTQDSWEDRLWREIFGRHSTLWNYSKQETLERTKDFISNELLKQRQEIIEEIKELRAFNLFPEDHGNQYKNMTLNRLLDLLERLEKDNG